MKKFRNLHSLLSAKIKTAIFQVFPELPSHTTKERVANIYKWKKSTAVVASFENLFCKVDDDNTNVNKIIRRVWPKKKVIADPLMAWAIAVTQSLLDPKNEYVKVYAEAVHPLYLKNLIS
jgi:hypothetical protein